MAWPQGNNFTLNRPPIPPMPHVPHIPEMDWPVSIVIVHSSTRSGLMVENLTPQLGDFFGVKNGRAPGAVGQRQSGGTSGISRRGRDCPRERGDDRRQRRLYSRIKFAERK